MKLKRYLAAILCAAMMLTAIPGGPAGVFMEAAPAETAPAAEQTETPAPEEPADTDAGQTHAPAAETEAEPAEEAAPVAAPEPEGLPDVGPEAETTAEAAGEPAAAPAGSSMETAFELAAGQTKTGRITRDVPVVYFHLTVGRTGSYQFASGGDTAVKAILMDADGRTAAAMKPDAADSGSSGPGHILSTVKLIKNISYYLAVESDNPGTTGTFTVGFSKEAPAKPPAETAVEPESAPTAVTVAETPAPPVETQAAVEATETPAAEPAPESPAETPAPPVETPAVEEEAAETPAAEPAPESPAETPVPPAETPAAEEATETPAAEPARESPAETPVPPVETAATEAAVTAPAGTEKPAYTSPPRLSGTGQTAGYAGSLEDLRLGTSPKGITRYPESSHPYGINEDSYQAYSEPGAIGYYCTFTASTEVEANYDYISFCDQDKNPLTIYTGGAEKVYFTGSELSGFQVYILYPTFHVRLESDNSVNKYGYKFASIIPIYPVSSGTTAIRACEQYGPNSAYLVWGDATDAGGYADGYRIYRSTSQYGSYSCIKTVYSTVTYNYSLTPGQTYWYKVLPYDSENVYSYSYSSAASVTIMETPVITSAVMSGSNTAYIAWTASTGADGYRLYRATSPNGTYACLKTVTGNYTYTGIPAANTAYYYKVKAYRIYSTEVSGSLSAASPMVRNDVPVISTARQSAARSTYIAWGAVQGADGYTLYRATNSAGPYAGIKSVTGTSTSNSSLATGQVYYYKVRAYTLSGSTRNYGLYSAPASVRILSVPVITAAQQSGTGNAYIAWNAVTGADGYTLYRAASAGGTYTGIKSVTGTSTTNSGLAAGTYYYKVAAYVLNGIAKVRSDKSAAAAVTISASATAYRALLIGNWQFPDASDNRPWDDCARNIKAALSYCNMNGTTYGTTIKYNQSASGVLSSIPAALSAADDNDVSLFYIGTHGYAGTGSTSGALYCSDGSWVYPTALRDALNQIKGTVIVFIDACGSGAYIKSSSASSAFNNAIISAFSGIEAKTGELKTSKFKVLTACAYNTSMWLVWDTYGYYYPSSYGYSYFSKYLCLAGGSNAEAYTSLRADTNGDSIVTLQEAYVYTRNNCNSANDGSSAIPAGDMVVQVYPANSTFPLFRR